MDNIEYFRYYYLDQNGKPVHQAPISCDGGINYDITVDDVSSDYYITKIQGLSLKDLCYYDIVFKNSIQYSGDKGNDAFKAWLESIDLKDGEVSVTKTSILGNPTNLTWEEFKSEDLSGISAFLQIVGKYK